MNCQKMFYKIEVLISDQYYQFKLIHRNNEPMRTGHFPPNQIHERWSWITFPRGGFAHFSETTKWPPGGGYPVPFSPRNNTCLVLLLTLIVNVKVFPTDNISCSISFLLFQPTVIGVSCVNCPITWLIWWFMRPCNLYNYYNPYKLQLLLSNKHP